MGHAITSGLLTATTKERAMSEGYRLAEEWWEHNGDRYESSGYHGDFRFYDKVFNTQEEAIEFFRSLGSYSDGVCMVKDARESSSIKKNKEKLRNLNIKEREYFDEFQSKVIEKFKERSSSTCSCSECETRYKKEIALKFKLICPVCRNWLVSDGVKEAYQKAKVKFASQREALEKTIRDQQVRDASNTSNVRYFYKVEVHC